MRPTVEELYRSQRIITLAESDYEEARPYVPPTPDKEWLLVPACKDEYMEVWFTRPAADAQWGIALPDGTIIQFARVISMSRRYV